MTLSEFIMDNTNDGRDIVRVLVDVMNGFIRGVKVSHQLTAARLLTIYGYQDARDFIDENVLHPSDEGREWVISDPELSRLIRARTNDGGDVCLFLIDVMYGRVEGIRIGHRVSAAKELLDRAFGRSQGLPMPNPPRETAPRGTIRNTDQQVAPVHPELVEGHEPVEGPAPSPVRHELVEGSEPTQPEFDDDLSARIFRSASKCIDPNFDPMRYATDDDYFWSYDGCDDIRCPYHGDPEDPDFYEDPNDHHY